MVLTIFLSSEIDAISSVIASLHTSCALAEEYVTAGGWSRVQRERLQMRLMLLDAQREVVIGNSEDVPRLRLTPIVVTSATVGYLGVLPGPELDELADIRFVDAQKRRFLIIAGAFVLLAAVLAFPLSSALTSRVRAIAAGARELAAGNYAARVDVNSHDELGRLGADFNDLAAALERTERSRREWVADISHELRTPLSTMRAEMKRGWPRFWRIIYTGRASRRIFWPTAAQWPAEFASILPRWCCSI